MMILWWIFISTAVLYGVVGWFATDHAWGTGTLWPDALSAKFWLLAAVSAITSFLTMIYWGRYVDKIGSKNVLVTCGFIIPFVSLWLITRPAA